MIHYILASTKKEHLQAATLVHDSYVETGYIQPRASGIYNPLRSSGYTVLGYLDNLPVCTVTCTRNGSLDNVFHDEMASLDGREYMEVGLLVSNYRMNRENVFTLMNWPLCICFDWWQCTDMLIGIHPKHIRSYKRNYGFQQISDIKEYENYNNSPVVLMRLKREQLYETNRPKGLIYHDSNRILHHKYPI